MTQAQIAAALREPFEKLVPQQRAGFQPANGALVHLPAIFFAGQPTTTRGTVSVLGLQVRITATPTWTWTFEPGATFTTTTPGAPYPAKDVTHTYQTTGKRTVELVTTWRGEVRAHRRGPLSDRRARGADRHVAAAGVRGALPAHRRRGVASNPSRCAQAPGSPTPRTTRLPAVTTYAAWLRGLGEQRLTEVLRLRPDAYAGIEPDSVEELAVRLASFPSVVAALEQLDVRGLEVVEVLQALGDGASRDRLDGLVGPVLPRKELEEALGTLERLALAWFERDGTLRLPEAMRHLVPAPLGLGAPLRRLLGTTNAEALKQLVRAIGMQPAGRKDENLGKLTAYFSDPKTVRTLVDSGPKATQRLLRELAFSAPLLEQPDYGYGYRTSNIRNPTVQWAQERALLLRRDWNYLELPREVGWALRGED